MRNNLSERNTRLQELNGFIGLKVTIFLVIAVLLQTNTLDSLLV